MIRSTNPLFARGSKNWASKSYHRKDARLNFWPNSWHRRLNVGRSRSWRPTLTATDARFSFPSRLSAGIAYENSGPSCRHNSPGKSRPINAYRFGSFTPARREARHVRLAPIAHIGADIDWCREAPKQSFASNFGSSSASFDTRVGGYGLPKVTGAFEETFYDGA